MRVFSTLVARSNENKSYMRVDESWLDTASQRSKFIIFFFNI